MLLFVGKKEKGFFTEETGEKVEYIDEALHIKDQAEAILRFNEEATVVIYDIEQYADEAKELVHWINRIEDALKIKTIIFAAGYSPQSTVCRMLWDAGVKNFIFSVYLGEQKEDLEYCLTGYYENFGYEEKRGFSFEEEEEKEESFDLKEVLNLLKKGTPVSLTECAVKEGETSPPKRYNSGSMILAMENAGQLIENEELREQIKGSGIGTSATRAEILKKLFSIEYLNLNKKNQIITPTLKGELVYGIVFCSMPSRPERM